jgi:hypothetical protein
MVRTMEGENARSAMRRVEEDVADLRRSGMLGDDGQLVSRLGSDWRELLGLIGPLEDPRTRACPRCGRMGMPSATRCGYCWMALEPLAPEVRPAGTGPQPRTPSERSSLAAFEGEGGALCR